MREEVIVQHGGVLKDLHLVDRHSWHLRHHYTAKRIRDRRVCLSHRELDLLVRGLRYRNLWSSLQACERAKKRTTVGDAETKQM